MSAETRGTKQTDSLAFIIVDIFTALWTYKRMIIAATLACVLVATAIAFALPKAYESAATLLLLPPPFKERGADAGVNSKDLVGMFPKLLSPTDYAALLKEGSLVLKIVDRLRAKGTYSEDDLEDLAKLSVLGEMLKVETSIKEKTAYQTEYSPVIRLVARAETPEMACDIAQVWADVAVEEASTFYKARGGGMTGFFSDEYEKTKGDLDQVYAQQREVEAAWEEVSARQRLIEKAILLTRLEDERARVFSDMESARKEVEQLSASLAKEKPTAMLWKSPPTTAMFLKDALSNPPAASEANPEETKKPGYYEETSNETYVYLQQELASRQATLGGLEERERSLRQSIDEIKKEQDTLREDTAKYSALSKVLKQKQLALSRGYDIVADRLRQARIAELEQERLADLKLVASAVVPDKKVAPLRTPIVLTAAFLGFMIACFGAVLRYRIETPR